MEFLTKYLLVFLFGGAVCIPAQILICKTRLTPARILTAYVVSGVVLGALGAYKPLVNIFHSGATVALTGFGAALAEGVKAAVEEKGLLGALTGGVTAMAAGLTAALTLSVICALIFRSKRKE